ncbi:YesL family protein [Planococcus sp. YIM B11945]|uniref:YesL family protein n=1 Tax=Planococcus sp. YIM B11945 TaxID=3435410 RepID=UPI003D7CD1E0
MRDFSGLTETLYIATEWIMRFSVINILWFILNIPIMFTVASFFLGEGKSGEMVYLLPLVVLLPALFVPSTAAMFATVREWILKKDQVSLIKTYFSHLKATYKKSFGSGIALMVFWLVWLLDFLYFKNENDVLSMAFVVIGLILFIFTINFFSLNAHYQMSNKQLMKNAFFVTLGNPLLSLFILVSNLSVFYVSATELLFLLPLFAGTVSAFLSFLAFYRFALKVEKKALGRKEG